MRRTELGLRLQVSYGIDAERCESLAEELAKAWERGWSASENGDHKTNPYLEPHRPRHDHDCSLHDCWRWSR